MSEADAAAVASKLLDFLREPARHRPRYINGQERISGQWVFKFAQARFPHSVLRAFDRNDRQRIREAARAFIRQVCFRDAATHYEMLGVLPTTRPEAVKGNYHLLMALIHPDRQDGAQAWPSACAQRVNQAYAVLSDERQRRDYDAGLAKLGNGAAQRAQSATTPHVPYIPLSPVRRRRRAVRAAMVVTAVIAALLFVQLLWVSDLPPEYRLLERAYPIAASAQWMRSVFSPAEAPRFVTENAWSPRTTDAAEITEPAPTIRRHAARVPLPVAVDAAVPDAVAPPPRPRPAETAATAPLSKPKASAVAVIPEQRPRVAQANPAANVVSPGISNSDIETLIAQLVSSYESGDVEGLMALVDRVEAASARGMRMRQAYDEFFRATRERHLRLNAIGWQSDAASAQARGEADLSARYGDQGAPVERRVAVEMDIGLRDGRARITRLALFPSGS